MLDSLITSKTRIKLLLKFFLNPETKAYLRSLAKELEESTNSIRVELNRLTEANLLNNSEDGRTKMYRANTEHPLFPELHNLVKKFLGIDQLIDTILAQLGNVKVAFITGDYAQGIDSGIIDLVVVGDVNNNYLQHLVQKAEGIIKRKIRTLVLNMDEFRNLNKTLKLDKAFLVWGKVD
jgi:hypothetical protein